MAILKALTQSLVGLWGLEGPGVELTHSQLPLHLQTRVPQSELEQQPTRGLGNNPRPLVPHTSGLSFVLCEDTTFP